MGRPSTAEKTLLQTIAALRLELAAELTPAHRNRLLVALAEASTQLGRLAAQALRKERQPGKVGRPRTTLPRPTIQWGSSRWIALYMLGDVELAVPVPGYTQHHDRPTISAAHRLTREQALLQASDPDPQTAGPVRKVDKVPSQPAADSPMRPDIARLIGPIATAAPPPPAPPPTPAADGDGDHGADHPPAASAPVAELPARVRAVLAGETVASVEELADWISDATLPLTCDQRERSLRTLFNTAVSRENSRASGQRQLNDLFKTTTTPHGVTSPEDQRKLDGALESSYVAIRAAVQRNANAEEIKACWSEARDLFRVYQQEPGLTARRPSPHSWLAEYYWGLLENFEKAEKQRPRSVEEAVAPEWLGRRRVKTSEDYS
jgi:hypothetical protein